MEIVNNPFKSTRMTLIENGLYSGTFGNWVDEEIEKWDKEQEEKRIQKKIDELTKKFLEPPMIGMSIPTLLRKPKEAMDRLMKANTYASTTTELPPFSKEDMITTFNTLKEKVKSYKYKTPNMYMSVGTGGVIPNLSKGDFPAVDYELLYGGEDGLIRIILEYPGGMRRERICELEEIFYDDFKGEWRLRNWEGRNKGEEVYTLSPVNLEANYKIQVDQTNVGRLASTPNGYLYFSDQENSSDVWLTSESNEADDLSEIAVDVFRNKPSFHKLFQHRFKKTGKRPF